MKKYVSEFLRRGLIGGSFGPIVLAVIYMILYHQNIVEVITVNEMCKGIFSLYFLAFIIGGMNVIYQLERLPLMAAIFIHGSALYFSYMCAYLINDWIEWNKGSVLIFTAAFVLGYLAVWIIIYSVTRHNTKKINEILNKKQQSSE